jgi:hypothetical protein
MFAELATRAKVIALNYSNKCLPNWPPSAKDQALATNSFAIKTRGVARRKPWLMWPVAIESISNGCSEQAQQCNRYDQAHNE